MVEIFPNMMKTTNPQIQKSQQASSRRNMKTATPRHIIIKLLNTNDKKKNIKSSQGKGTLCKGTSIRLAVDLFLETMRARQL